MSPKAQVGISHCRPFTLSFSLRTFEPRTQRSESDIYGNARSFDAKRGTVSSFHPAHDLLSNGLRSLGGQGGGHP